MKYKNKISVLLGVMTTIAFCMAYVVIIQSKNPAYLLSGILAIIGIIFAGGIKKIPIEHKEVLKVFGKRWKKIQFEEGLVWTFPVITSTEGASSKIKMVDLPPLVAITKGKKKIPMETDAQIFYQMVDPDAYLKIDPEIIEKGLTSKAQEANREVIGESSYNQALGTVKIVEEKIKKSLDEEKLEEKWGIKVTDVDVRTVLPTKSILEELEKDKNRQIKTEEFIAGMKKIKEETPDLSDDTLTNVTQVVQGFAKKDIQDQKKTLKLDLEKEAIELIIGALKKTLERGGKK